jgi:hypothetical protein
MTRCLRWDGRPQHLKASFVGIYGVHVPPAAKELVSVSTRSAPEVNCSS